MTADYPVDPRSEFQRKFKITFSLMDAWHGWLDDNPHTPAQDMLDHLARIAGEQRRPSNQPQRRKMFKGLRS